MTALWPFLPVDALDDAVERRLEDCWPASAAFPFTLERVADLADAVVLVPEPAEPFGALTRLLWDEWPECPPFGGAFDDIAPHLVVAVDPPPADRAAIDAALAPHLPLAARATEVLLVEETGSGPLRVRRSFALGGLTASAAPAARRQSGSSRPTPSSRARLERELAGHDILERHAEVEAEESLVRRLATRHDNRRWADGRPGPREPRILSACWTWHHRSRRSRWW